jgi:hypothetical protein
MTTVHHLPRPGADVLSVGLMRIALDLDAIAGEMENVGFASVDAWLFAAPAAQLELARRRLADALDEIEAKERDGLRALAAAA